MYPMKNLRFVVTIVAFTAACFIVATPVTAVACSCAPPPSPSEAEEAADAVFTGTVVEMEQEGGSVRVRLHVDEARKGADTDEIVVHTAASPAACGFTFRLDKTYLVYAHRSDDQLRVSLCSRSRQVEDRPYQPPASRWAFVSFDPITTLLGFINMQVELAPSFNWSFYVGPHLRMFDGILTDESEPYRGVGVEVGLRYFPLSEAPMGFWIGARTVNAYLHKTDPDAEESVVGWGGYNSVLAGYTVNPIGALILSGGIGVQYINYGLRDYGTTGFFPALQTTIGLTY